MISVPLSPPSTLHWKELEINICVRLKGREEEIEECSVDLLLGRAHYRLCLRRHLLDFRHGELSQPQQANRCC